MPTVPAIILDGVMPYGSISITASNGVAYILEEFTVDRTATNADDNNALGSPQRRRSTHERSTFTAIMQLATASTARPGFGDTFTVNVDANYGNELFTFDPVPTTLSNGPGDIRKVNVKGWKCISGSITKVGTNTA